MDLKRFLRAEWDRVAGYGCLLAGVVLLIVGFQGVRNAADVIDEISYLVSGGIGSMFLLGVGATLLLSADLHDDFRKLHRVEQKLDRIERLLLAERPGLVDLSTPAPPEDDAADDAEDDADDDPDPGFVRQGRLLAAAGLVVAGVLFAAGWLRTATEPGTGAVAGGVGLAVAGALGAALVAGVMVTQLKAALEDRKLAVLGPWLGDEATVTTVGPGVSSAAGEAAVWVVDGLALYHRAGCRALEGRNASERDRGVLGSGLSPCGLCEP